MPCPRGSYTNSTGNGNMSDCKPCSRGKYCDPNAGVMQERDCDPGFVCLTGELEAFFPSIAPVLEHINIFIAHTIRHIGQIIMFN